MHALYSPCTRRMGLHQTHIGMTGITNSLALYMPCWGSEYKGLAPDTMPGRCSTCDSIQMHTGVGVQ